MSESMGDSSFREMLVELTGGRNNDGWDFPNQDTWAISGDTDEKPQLIKNGRRIECNTANYVSFVVPGQSTSSSGSPSPTSPTVLSQEAVTPTQHPASTGSESVSDGSTTKFVAWTSRNRRPK